MLVSEVAEKIRDNCYHSWANARIMTAVKLNSLRFENPKAPALVIMHGLLGASRNWQTIGKALKDRFDIHILDLRNHGSSPHADSMRWSELTADLAAYLKAHDLKGVTLMGHSLGGKIGMKFACDHSALVKKLIIVDIAAKAYPPYHDNEFRAMKRVPAGALENRREAEELLKPLIPDWGMRQFIMTNLVKGEFGLQWQCNLEVLHSSLQVLRQNSLSGSDIYQGPALLITGGKSNFIKDGDVKDMRQWLPQIKQINLLKAGHNVHVDDRSGFLDALNKWL
jgi:pimeloyl-ACP methyl ester carboxylesterase